MFLKGCSSSSSPLSTSFFITRLMTYSLQPERCSVYHYHTHLSVPMASSRVVFPLPPFCHQFSLVVFLFIKGCSRGNSFIYQLSTCFNPWSNDFAFLNPLRINRSSSCDLLTPLNLFYITFSRHEIPKFPLCNFPNFLTNGLCLPWVRLIYSSASPMCFCHQSQSLLLDLIGFQGSLGVHVLIHRLNRDPIQSVVICHPLTTSY